MSGVEILFILSLITLLVVWGWFVILGFRISRGWGIGLIFLFPISPCMFVYRFERKTRQIVYPFIGSLLFFIGMVIYIHVAAVGFYSTLYTKISNAIPKIEFSTKVKTRSLNLPPPTPIPESPETLDNEEVEVQVNEPVIKKTVATPPKPPRRYKVVNIEEIGAYIGKKVIISTSTVQHQGKLLSANSGRLEIKKSFSGGFMIRSFQKGEIKKVEVYL